MEYFVDYFEPENYKLDLKIDKIAKTLSGTVIITGTPKSDTIKLHAVDMKIESVKIDGKEADFEYDGKNGTLIIRRTANTENELSERARSKKIHLSISYGTSLNENMQGAYLSTYQLDGATETIVATQFESHYAREAFPCIDEPAAKATFDLEITLPKDTDDLILANTPIKEQNENVTIFEQTPRMSTYLLAFVVGHFHGKTIKNQHGVTITTYAPLNQPLDSVDFANEVAAKSLEFYDDEFGVPYPLTKLDQVALPDFEAGAMENWGLVTYRESMLLADKTATLGTKKSVALTVAHELSHQWFGDLVTMKWWDDLWLNESFASIMEYMAVDAIYPGFKIWEGFFTGDCLSALKRDAYSDVQSVHQPVSSPAEIATLFDGAIVYSKGARLMLMLIRAMSWGKFKQGINDYFNKYAYQNTVGDNLWDALAPYADFNPKSFMHAWIEKPGYPVITEGNQQRFRLDGPLEASEWPLPHISADMSGHYVINLSEAEFAEKIANFGALGLEEKLRLLIDRSLLVKTPLAPSASLLGLIEKFKTENSAAIWSIIVTIIGSLKIFFEPESKEEAKFKAFVAGLISDKLAEIGLVTRQNDDENTIRLRAILLALDFYAENRENLKKLSSLYDQNLTSLDSEIRADILNARLFVSPNYLDQYLTQYQSTADPEIKSDLLLAMSLTKDQKNIDKLISLLDRPEIIKPQDHLFFFIYLYRNAKASPKVFTWITTHWDYVMQLAGDKTIEDYPRYMANTIRTRVAADEFYSFFDSKTDIPALSRALKIARAEIESRLELIEADKKAVYDYLNTKV